MKAETIAKALGGRKAGRGWMAHCPAHDDHDASLSIRDADDGKVLVRCHACCNQLQVIAAIRARGLWERRNSRHGRRNGHHPHQTGGSRLDRDDFERTELALRIWRATTTALGTPVETYLQWRGIHLPPTAALRFHFNLKHPSGGYWPVMVALVTNGADGTPIAIHRTYLARDGLGKAAVDSQKMMLGPCRGGAVRLAVSGNVLMIGEGIETCLAAMQATGNPAWAALSTSGLRILDLPKDVRDVIVLADGDEAGEAAAQDCGWRWKREGRRVRIARPPRGMDFNDLLLGAAPDLKEGEP
jgi:hypothetical protein